MKQSPQPPANAQPLLLTRQDLCTRLQLSKRTIARMLSTGQLPPAVRIGRNVRWRADAIDAWIDQGCPPMNGRAK
jgi:excisionase family DNA binding protein